MKLQVNAISSEYFTWNWGERALVTEASCLGNYDGFQRLFDDAADVGLAVKSSRTGKVERFYFNKRNELDGEITDWEYLPENPDCGVKKLVIFND